MLPIIYPQLNDNLLVNVITWFFRRGESIYKRGREQMETVEVNCCE